MAQMRPLLEAPGAGRRRRRVRLPCRPRAPGACLDAGSPGSNGPTGWRASRGACGGATCATTRASSARSRGSSGAHGAPTRRQDAVASVGRDNPPCAAAPDRIDRDPHPWPPGLSGRDAGLGRAPGPARRCRGPRRQRRDRRCDRSVARRHDATLLTLAASAGLNAARNAGVEAAAGDLIVFIDDDVEARRAGSTPCSRAFAQLPTARCSAGRSGRGSRAAAHVHADASRRRSPRLTAVPTICDVPLVWSANMAIRRSAFDRIGTFDETILTVAATKKNGSTDTPRGAASAISPAPGWSTAARTRTPRSARWPGRRIAWAGRRAATTAAKAAPPLRSRVSVFCRMPLAHRSDAAAHTES